MQANEIKPDAGGQEAFDRAHLDHYTMQNQELAAEVLNLFLTQLPATLALLEGAAALADWKFAAHALKGSAAAVGAWKLHQLAADLEKLPFPGEAGLRLLRIQALKGAIAEFRQLARGAYPAIP